MEYTEDIIVKWFTEQGLFKIIKPKTKFKNEFLVFPPVQKLPPTIFDHYNTEKLEHSPYSSDHVTYDNALFPHENI